LAFIQSSVPDDQAEMKERREMTRAVESSEVKKLMRWKISGQR
jgi:hypothetical protein